jgi:hypothetical protein
MFQNSKHFDLFLQWLREEWCMEGLLNKLGNLPVWGVWLRQIWDYNSKTTSVLHLQYRTSHFITGTFKRFRILATSRERGTNWYVHTHAQCHFFLFTVFVKEARFWPRTKISQNLALTRQYFWLTFLRIQHCTTNNLITFIKKKRFLWQEHKCLLHVYLLTLLIILYDSYKLNRYGYITKWRLFLGFCITCFLSFVVLMQTTMQFLPQIASPMSLLCVYVFLMMCFSVFINIVTVLMLRIYHKPEKEKVRHYDVYITWLFKICVGVENQYKWRRGYIFFRNLFLLFHYFLGG